MDALTLIKDEAPWLLSPDLGVCIVGSQALAIACREASVDGPDPSDLDLSWALAHEEGAALLTQHGVLVPTTTGNQERGTLACKVGGLRVEITSFRAGDADAPMPERIEADLSERDMTIGAIAVEVATGRVHDPLDGLQHYRDQRIVPVGDPAQRVNEHGIRWLRYFRKAHEFGFLVDNAIRGLKRSLDPSLEDGCALFWRSTLGKSTAIPINLRSDIQHRAVARRFSFADVVVAYGNAQSADPSWFAALLEEPACAPSALVSSWLPAPQPTRCSPR